MVMSRVGADGDGASMRDCMRLAELGDNGLPGTSMSIVLGLFGPAVVPARFLEAPRVADPGPLERARSAAMFGAFPTDCAMSRFVVFVLLSQRIFNSRTTNPKINS